jgi:chaperonin GroES
MSMATETKDKEKKNAGASAAKGFQPLGDRVFITYTEEMERTAGGIYVPESAKEKPQRGTVQAIGKDVKNLKVGDQVLFDKYSGSKLKIDDEDCLILKEEDVLGVFTTN